MYRLPCIVMIGLLCWGSPAGAAKQGTDREISTGALWFPIGETIEYKVMWGRIPVGRSVVTTEWIEADGLRFLAIRLRTRSNKVLSSFYPVDDFIESIIDPETFLPVRFTKKLREGTYRCHEVTTFNHETGIATFENKKRNFTRKYEIESDTRDLISFMYLMRTMDIPVGTTLDFRVMADEKIYDLSVRALKEEPVKLPRHGTVESVLFQPTAEFQGLFVRKGKLRIWVSGDERRIITKAAIKIPVANVNLLLDQVTGPGEDRWVQDEPEKRKVRRIRRKKW